MQYQEDPNSSIGARAWCEQPVRFVQTGPGSDTRYLLPDDAKAKMVIDVIHDGDVIPEEFQVDWRGEPIPREAYWDTYLNERDFGASELARQLTRLLGLDGFWNVEIARVVMDFGRFPGITPKDADHLSRKAINYPFSEWLGFDQKRRILEHYYDGVSAYYNRLVEPAQLKIAIHTYDTFNHTGTLRPPASILTRCVGYQRFSEMPFGVFDPLYPDILGQFTCDRILRDRLSLTLERYGLHTEHNYPYLLPDGSVEVRSQVWNFFRTARAAFEAENPHSKDSAAFRQVWEMLLDTNLRSSESESLRSYLHAYRRVPVNQQARYVAAYKAYVEISQFLHRDNNAFVERYRVSRRRPSALGFEVRKDLVVEFDERGRPVAAKVDEARKIAEIIAHAIHIYFTEDRPKFQAFEMPSTAVLAARMHPNGL